MSLDACAALVQRGDPDRWAALLAMPVAARARLLPLYAYNLEIARAPWVTAEPMIAEMRLQWWRDVVANAAAGGGVAKAHEVAAPLHGLIRERGLDTAALDRMAAARRCEAWGEPFADEAALWAFLDDTGGSLMWLAAQALGAGNEAAARDLGTAAGLAGYFAALPELAARGRPGLPDAAPAAIVRLAGHGLARLARARTARRGIGPAGLAAWLAEPLLRRALKDPAAVPLAPLTVPEITRRGRLLWVAATGRW